MIIEGRYLQYCLAYPYKSWKNKFYKRLFKKNASKNSLYYTTIKEVSEYTKLTPERIKEIVKKVPIEKFEIFHDALQPQLTKEKVESFYHDYDHYIYELPLWNAEVGRPQMIRAICDPYFKKFQCKRILDVGGGAGDLCIELASHGYDMDYFDISPPLFNFAQWRFKKRNINVCQYIQLNQIKKESSDAVVTFDVLEHVKNLPDFIENILAVLKPGGVFIFSGAFSGGGIHLRENEPYANIAVMNDLMRSMGCRFYDKFAQNFVYLKEI